VLLGAAAMFLTAACKAARRAAREHGSLVLLWRFVTGADMARGRVHVCEPGQACPAGYWAHMRRRHRAAARLAATAAAAGCAWGAVADRGALAAALIAAAAAALAVAAARAWRGGAARRHDRGIVRPMAAALARVLPAAEAEARRMITLPPGYARKTRGELGAITLPDWYPASPEQRKQVDHLVATHLPVDVETTWRTAGAPKKVIISVSPSPPELVPFAAVRELMEACRPGDVLIGLDRRSDPYTGSFNGGDDPHWGFSVGSGRGKSTFLCVTAAQILRQDPGASVLGVDPKMSSLDPLAGLPGVELANDPRDIPGMWQAIARYKAQMEERVTAKKADPTLEFPVKLLLLDELNQFAAMSAAWWKALGEKDTPPVWMDIAAVLWMGRFVHCHALLVGQRLDDKATGGIGLRDSLGLRGLAGFRPNQWKMLVGTTPVPKSQKPRGRWIYTDGQQETWVQNICGTAQEIRDWASAGRRPAAPGVSVRPAPASTDAASQDGHSPLPGTVWITGISAAANYLSMTQAAFEKARQRQPVDGEIRRGNQPAWSADNLRAWAASRPRASSTAKYKDTELVSDLPAVSEGRRASGRYAPIPRRDYWPGSPPRIPRRYPRPGNARDCQGSPGSQYSGRPSNRR